MEGKQDDKKEQMPRLAPKPIRLDNEEEQELEKILARHSTSQQIAKRAKIILMASQEKNERVVSTDEMTGIQAKERKFPDKPMKPAQPVKREFEYIRHRTSDPNCQF